MSLYELTEYLAVNAARYAILQNSSTVLRTTFSPNQTKKMLGKLEKIKEDLSVGESKIYLPYVLFKMSADLTIVLLVKIGRQSYQKIFKKLTSLPEFTTLTQPSTNSIGDLVLHHLFALARTKGPEPISSISIINGSFLKEESEWRYAMSALLILANQTTTKRRDILTFHPFLGEDKLGLVYLFKTPLEDARGGAFDSCILTLVDYENRQYIYDKHLFMEDIYSNAADGLKRKFMEIYSGDINQEITDPYPFNEVLEELQKDLLVLNTAPSKSETIKKTMLHSIREISKL